MKLLIIGNAGCGKTYLAKKLEKKYTSIPYRSFMI
jgi:adenylate kinase family enzyme